MWSVITAEQWIAFGTFWGAIAQLGLVVVAIYSARQWVYQARISGLRNLIDEYLVSIHAVDVSLSKARSIFRSHDIQKQELQMIYEQYVELMGLALRCAYYDEHVADAIKNVALHLQTLLVAYQKHNDIKGMFVQQGLSDVEKERLHREMKELGKLLTHTNQDPWYDKYLDLQSTVVFKAKKLTWGID
jgi:hypothetical protein